MTSVPEFSSNNYPYFDFNDDRSGCLPVKSSEVDKAVSRWRGGDLAKGLIQSKFIIATFFSGLAVGALFAIMIYGFGMMPSDWMITATAIGSYVLGLLVQLPFFKGLQKLECEFATTRRLFKTNCDEILSIQDKGTLYLGALPNRLRSEGETLVNEKNINSILSLNEPWERLPYSLSLPYSDNDWRELNILNYKKLDIKDHSLLEDGPLNEAAEFIHEELNAGRNVYVHCLGGVGRSGMAIAAYLIRYHDKTVAEAADLLKAKRPSVTIMKKIDRLEEYRRKLENHSLN